MPLPSGAPNAHTAGLPDPPTFSTVSVEISQKRRPFEGQKRKRQSDFASFQWVRVPGQLRIIQYRFCSQTLETFEWLRVQRTSITLTEDPYVDRDPSCGVPPWSLRGRGSPASDQDCAAQ